MNSLFHCTGGEAEYSSLTSTALSSGGGFVSRELSQHEVLFRHAGVKKTLLWKWDGTVKLPVTAWEPQRQELFLDMQWSREKLINNS